MASVTRLLVVPVLSFLLFFGLSNGQSLTSDFEETIDPWITNSADTTQWALTSATGSDILYLPTPVNGKSFLLLQPPEGNDGSAVLWSPDLDLPNGGNFSIDFWIRSKYFQSNNLEVYLGPDRLLSLTEYSTPYNIYWRTAHAYIPAGLRQPVQISIRGFKSGLHEDNIGIDNIKIVSADDGLTTTEEPTTPQINSTDWTEPTPTGNSTDTTEDPTGSTGNSTDTTEDPTGSTGNSTEPTPTGNSTEPTLPETSPTPGGSTPEPTSSPYLTFDFVDGLQGWTLARQNGARWKRSTELPANGPASGYPDGAVLEVGWIDLYSGPTIAQSPLLVVEENSVPALQITFWIKGSFKRPAQLHLKRKVNDTFDEEPFANLDTFGQAENKDWITVTKIIPSSGSDPFQIVLYGFLGLDFQNQILVDNILVSGVQLAYPQQESTFTFETGLQGWLPSNLDGGSWVPRKYNEVAGASHIPPPPSGESGVLFATAFDENAGIITIESPPLTINSTDTPLIAQITFWISDTTNQPAWLLVRKKTAAGQYDTTPFIDSTPLGTSASQNWYTLQEQIPLSNGETTFQLVVEAYLGGRILGLIAIDRLQITAF